MMNGIVAAGVGLGVLIMSPLAGWLILDHGWQNSFIIVGIMALVLTMLGAQFLRRDPSQKGLLPYGESEAKQGSSFLEADDFSIRETIHTRQFWLFSGMFFCFLLVHYAILMHIVIHATGLGIPGGSAVNILTIIGGLSIAGMLIMGSVADRVGNRLVFIIGFALMALAAFWLLAAKEVWMFYLFASIFGFAYGSLQVLFSPMVAELFGLRSHGVILGLSSFAGTIGGAIGPVLAGYIFDISGSYNTAFLISGGVSVIGVILVLLLRPTRGEGGTNEARRST